MHTDSMGNHYEETPGVRRPDAVVVDRLLPDPDEEQMNFQQLIL